MRKIIFILFALISINACAQVIDSVENGDRMRQIRGKMNQSFMKGNDVHNIINYGAVGDDATDNTAAIQEAIDSAAVRGGIVYIPVGVFKSRALTTYYNVSIHGSGGSKSQIKSIAADTLITMLYADYGTGNLRAHPMIINNLYLNGDSIGVAGLHTRRLFHFRIEGLRAEYFTKYGVFNDGSLIGEFDACYIAYCPIGIYDSTQASPLSDSDEIRINNSQIQKCNKYGVRHVGGAQLRITNTHIHLNGTNGDSLTGGVFVSDPNGSQRAEARNEGMIPLLYMDNCWYENYGGVGVTIDSARDVNQLCVIQNTQWKYSDFANVHASIQMYDSKPTQETFTKLILYNNNFQDNKAIVATGDSTIIIDHSSFIRGGMTLRGGATYTSLTDFYGNLSPPSGAVPADQSTAQGWATIYVGGTEYRIKLYK